MQADYSQLAAACDQMDSVVAEMERAKSSYGLACAVVEFSESQRKSALSRAMLSFLKEGDSVAAADAKARASDSYKADMQRLMTDYANAEETRSQYFALKARWETRPEQSISRKGDGESMKASTIWPNSRMARKVDGIAPTSPATVPVQSEPTTERITGTVREIKPGKIEGVFLFRLWNDPLDRTLMTDNADTIKLLSDDKPVTVTVEQITGQRRKDWKTVNVEIAKP